MGTLEAWVYPLKVLDDFRLSFRLHDYPLDIEGPTSRHDQCASGGDGLHVFARRFHRPPDRLRALTAGIVMLLDVDSVLPLTVTGSFRPRLRPMWPAGLMTPNLEWDAGRTSTT